MRSTQPALDLRVLEVKEVPGVVPDEAFLLDGLAPAADLAIGLEDEVVVVAASRERCGGREAGDPGADDERADGIHVGGHNRGGEKKDERARGVFSWSDPVERRAGSFRGA